MNGRRNRPVSKQFEAADRLPVSCFRRSTEVGTWGKVTWLST